MALETNCLTDGCFYHTLIEDKHIEVVVSLPEALILTEDEAEELEKLLHNQVELVMAYALRNKTQQKNNNKVHRVGIVRHESNEPPRSHWISLESPEKDESVDGRIVLCTTHKSL